MLIISVDVNRVWMLHLIRGITMITSNIYCKNPLKSQFLHWLLLRTLTSLTLISYSQELGSRSTSVYCILTGEICYPTHNGHCGCAAGLECISEKKTAGKGEIKFEYTLSTCQKNGEGSGEGSGEEPLIVEEE